MKIGGSIGGGSHRKGGIGAGRLYLVNKPGLEQLRKHSAAVQYGYQQLLVPLQHLSYLQSSLGTATYGGYIALRVRRKGKFLSYDAE